MRRESKWEEGGVFFTSDASSHALHDSSPGNHLFPPVKDTRRSCAGRALPLLSPLSPPTATPFLSRRSIGTPSLVSSRFIVTSFALGFVLADG